jgi:hypothetical protein
MKRIGHLLERIAERGNLALAFWKAARGRRHSNTARRFARGLDETLSILLREILDGSVSSGQYLRFVVFDPKQRTIHAAPFRERVLHHAIMNVCGPVFERDAIQDSFACRTGKGNSAALERARYFAARHRYFLKLDIRLLPTSQGMPFLGFRIMPDRVLLGRRARRRFRSRLAVYERAYGDGSMGAAELQRRVMALVAHTDQAHCRSWRRQVLVARSVPEERVP